MGLTVPLARRPKVERGSANRQVFMKRRGFIVS
jgi:hypothetical protein